MSEKELTSNLVDLLCGILEHLVPFLLILFNSRGLGLCLLLGFLLGCLEFVHGEYEGRKSENEWI